MNEFYSPLKNNGGDNGYTAYDEPETPINIVVDNGGDVCSYCGNPLSPHDMFCGKCGSKRDPSAAQPQQSYNGGIGIDLSKGHHHRRHGAEQQMFGQQPYGQSQPPINGQSYGQVPPQPYGQQGSAFDSRTMGNQFGIPPQGQTIINNFFTNSGNTMNYGSNNINMNQMMMPGMKSKKVALLLCLFLGWCGAHRYYEGKIFSGIIWTLTAGLGGIGWLADIIRLLFKPPYYKP